MTRPREQCGLCYSEGLRQNETPCDWCRENSRHAVTRAKAAMYEDWIREHHPDCPLLVENIVAEGADSGSRGGSDG